MNNIFLVSLLLCAHSFVLGQHVKNVDSVKIKIYIIGVVHSENKFRNTDSLLNILKDIKPDLILSEVDTLSGYFKSDYTLVQPPKWYKIARKLKLGRKMPPEMDLLYKYRELNSSVLIYPFDMPIENRKQYVKNIKYKKNLWVTSLNLAFNKNELPDSIVSTHKNYIGFNTWFYDICQTGYFLMNRRVATDSIRQMMKLENEYYPKLFNSVQHLSEYKKWYTDDDAFWKLRNDVMAKNIIRFADTNNAKTVVVFTGLLHKYILTDLLNSYNTGQKYELVEYFEK
jgi:hypothetical protein